MLTTIYQVVSKELLCRCKQLDRPSVLLLGPLDISVVNICRIKIHSGLGIKPRFRLLGLRDKMKKSLRKKISEVKNAIIEEFSMV